MFAKKSYFGNPSRTRVCAVRKLLFLLPVFVSIYEISVTKSGP